MYPAFVRGGSENRERPRLYLREHTPAAPTMLYQGFIHIPTPLAQVASANVRPSSVGEVPGVWGKSLVDNKSIVLDMYF